MFIEKNIYDNQKKNKIDRLVDINFPDNKPLFIEPSFNPNPDRLFFKSSMQIEKPDWSPDFSEKFDVVGDSINLALHTLGMSRGEYNSLDVSGLKTQRQIDCSCEQIWALNILIHYKKNALGGFPALSPIKCIDQNNKSTVNYEFNNNYQLRDEINHDYESKNKLYSSEDFSIYDK